MNDQLKPVAGQSRFTSPKSDWQPCSYEHHLMVQLCPNEWPGYETRALYALPDRCVVVPREVLERALQDCMFLPLEETVRRNIERNAAVRELRVLLAQQGQEVAP